MTPKIAFALSVSALVLFSGGVAHAAPSTASGQESVRTTSSKAAYKMTAKERKVLQLTNKARAKAGCKPLKANTKLAKAARKHSKDMAVNHYFSHDSQDGSSPWDRIKREGYKYPGAENIAAGYPTAAAVVKGWMNSKGHRANILNCKLKALGVGHYQKYWTQDFGWK
ncbi:uncharacterized protein YkwD [Actinocorallia herbida]|uniref:Uncharacterized protein YkwD n=1 Tax=Actinocorallia herbida TaxID=58109 RepID=A0A3N1D887_9ACTN|nr:CAP domain-containing protein [Actinocorallia herbida]ROO89308.1 uncharacterized protein YkwD [Actinocorallia herbida]